MSEITLGEWLIVLLILMPLISAVSFALAWVVFGAIGRAGEKFTDRIRGGGYDDE